MNALHEPFPETVRVGGRDFPIRTDFRDVLRMIRELEGRRDAAGRLMAVLSLYKEIPEDLEGAVRAVTDFVAGEPEDERDDGEDRKRQKTISYEKDAPYIIGDFLHFYGLDLTACGYLHWQKFQTLLMGISEDSEIKKRIAYRCVDAGKIKDRQERARILRIQKAIAVEGMEADALRIGELFGMLE